MKRWWVGKSVGFGIRGLGFKGLIWNLLLDICIVLDKWLGCPEPYLPGWNEGNKVEKLCGTRLWGILTAKPRSPGSVQSARGTLQVFHQSSALGKLTQPWHIRGMEGTRRWRWGDHLEGFCSRLYERQWLIKSNSLNCVSALWVMSHYHKSPASP